MLKRYLFVLISLIVFLVACGETEEASSNEGSETGDTKTEEKAADTVEFETAYSAPKDYIDYEIEFTGQVFVDPERDSDGVYLQVYADPINYEKNTIVGVKDPSFEVSTNDYVRIKGIIMDEYEGENAFGGIITAPVVEAAEIEVVDYITAVAPTIKTIDVNQEIDQHGYVINVEKIELAETQTRVYLKVINNTDAGISFYTHSAKLIVDNKQLEEEYLYDSGLPELQSEILSGIETEGVIVFPAVEEDVTALRFFAEGYSDNYELEINPFEFEITVE